MQEQFHRHIASNFSGLLKKKFLIAVSGGVDSVVLAHLCHRIGLNFSLAHCNFSLRESESNTDEIFVKKLGESLHKTCHTTRFDTLKYAKENSLSTQIAARKLRYDWFETLSQKNGYAYILTAHHLDDNLETFLINFTRGTGLSGLTGIPEKNGLVLRPLLKFNRSEIVTYAKAEQITWREDSSNATDAYLRNRIRHHITPFLKNENTHFFKGFRHTIKHLVESQELLADYKKILQDQIINEISSTEFHLDLKRIKNHPHPKAVLYHLLNEFGFSQWKDIYGLLSAQSGKVIYAKPYQLIKDREKLILTQLNTTPYRPVEVNESQKHLIFPEGQLFFKIVTELEIKAKEIAYLAREKLNFPLTLRKWEQGDRFQPLGIGGQKKVSDFLIDQKLSLAAKEKIWVLESKGKIAWIVGLRIDERFKVEAKSQKILKIDFV